jgi:hypothetical protein
LIWRSALDRLEVGVSGGESPVRSTMVGALRFLDGPAAAGIADDVISTV